jgi:hypothetical protein
MEQERSEGRENLEQPEDENSYEFQPLNGLCETFEESEEMKAELKLTTVEPGGRKI